MVVDDEVQIVRALTTNLKARGYAVAVAATGEDAIRMAADRPPDLIILDLGLPGIDGIEVLKRLRTWTALPVIVLSARGEQVDKIEALDAGADDYVSKPFAMGELLARVRAGLRRAAPVADPIVVETDDFTVDLGAKTVVKDGHEIRLTPTEWGIVELLIGNPGKLVTQPQILDQVWGHAHVHETHYLRVYMAQIRRKLEPDPSSPRYFHTEPGVGYRFDPKLRP